MIIAIPFRGDRISPVFDVASNLLLIQIEDHREVSRGCCSLAGMTNVSKIDVMKKNDVDRLLCGAISDVFHQMIVMNNIEVDPWHAGDIGEIVHAVIKDEISSPRFCMPGCRKRRRHHGFGRHNK